MLIGVCLAMTGYLAARQVVMPAQAGIQPLPQSGKLITKVIV